MGSPPPSAASVAATSTPPGEDVVVEEGGRQPPPSDAPSARVPPAARKTTVSPFHTHSRLPDRCETFRTLARCCIIRIANEPGPRRDRVFDTLPKTFAAVFSCPALSEQRNLPWTSAGVGGLKVVVASACPAVVTDESSDVDDTREDVVFVEESREETPPADADDNTDGASDAHATEGLS
ncbi:hypothetical protein PRIPAC_95232 [Pristionchus pacificus]|uniref:Uncharacterized protein n=1 Tax=Pristionchus pacificus TaxID=54126 RepID=A0A2A6D2X2_PRIPA|nr:hypothetical protein PRIPAC_95232 [Pristionchus pacificus]|eukprot:PDM84657.1 hypothetical protein PRIPAC_33680 [Pristionchus pacificus]